ncbi:MAG: Arginine utilization regulatory protein RocR [Syntrophorhabdus sp. PtaU1.Bin058]|nr:MAG: Arginine utilization regulatory protein RocR [Syntrophorhabdus sp. PtaU1.Bin058]
MKKKAIYDEILSDFSTEILGEYGLNPIITNAMRFYFRNPYESTIIVDKDMRVQFMDKMSEEFFGLKRGGAKDVDIRELVPQSGLPSAIETGMPTVGRILEIRGVKRIGAVYPIKEKGKIIGGIGKIIFHSLEEVERINAEIQKLKREVRYLKQREGSEHSSLYSFNNILSKSILMKETIATAKKISLFNADVLILGESGTGKELFAHSIHSFALPDKPFVKINCPAIPFDLAESVLFGYEKGTFTGAVSSGKSGSFERADNGTVFLDEISSLPLSIQAKLLRVLQEKEIERLGSAKTKKINFRFVAATNTNLKRLVEEGRFREDLYYRVTKVTLSIPPLRERREDVPLYLYHYLEKINQSYKTQIKQVSKKVMDILVNYNWPGNVRELINVLEQTIIKASNDKEIRTEHLPPDILVYAQKTHYASVPEGTHDIKQEITEAERNLIVSALRQTKGNKRKAAVLLSMPRSTLYEKIRRHDIHLDW